VQIFLHPLQVRLGRLVAARGLDVRLGGSPQHATLGHKLRSLLQVKSFGIVLV